MRNAGLRFLDGGVDSMVYITGNSKYIEKHYITREYGTSSNCGLLSRDVLERYHRYQNEIRSIVQVLPVMNT